jgi:PAS domain S-box-containing protein
VSHEPTALDGAPVALAIVTSEGVIVAANARLVDLVGRRGRLTGTSLFDLFHPDDAPGAAAAFRRFLRGDSPDCDVLHRLPGGDGREQIIRLRASRAADGAVVVLDDATADRQALAELAQRDERFRHLIENATDLITLLAADGTILYLSPSSERARSSPPATRPRCSRAAPTTTSGFSRSRSRRTSCCVRSTKRSCSQLPDGGGDRRRRSPDGSRLKRYRRVSRYCVFAKR